MRPAFESFSAFLDMGGYAFYVWLSVAVTVLAIASLAISIQVQYRQLLTQLFFEQQRELRIRKARSQSSGEQHVNAP